MHWTWILMPTNVYKNHDWYSAILSSDHWMNSPESEADPETARPAIAAPGLDYQQSTIA
jgi:hypothetical protein